MTTYHRTLMLIEVLGDRPYIGGIEDLGPSVSLGDFSGTILMESTGEVGVKQMAQLLVMQGSDPSFLIPEDDEHSDGDGCGIYGDSGDFDGTSEDGETLTLNGLSVGDTVHFGDDTLVVAVIARVGNDWHVDYEPMEGT